MKFLRKSNTAANLLRKTLTQLGKETLTPIIDVSTRWNSTLYMLERYLSIRPAVLLVLVDPSIKRGQCENLSENDILIVEQIIQVLKIMETATKTLSEADKPTASLLLPLKYSILKQLDKSDNDTLDPAVHEAKMCIMHDLEKRYTDPSLVKFLEECSALDIRFKSLWWLNQMEKEVVYERITSKMILHHQQQTGESGDRAATSSSRTSSNNEAATE